MMRPHVLAIVEMEEGFQLTSRIIDIDPADGKIGMQVEAAFRTLGSEGDAGRHPLRVQVPDRLVRELTSRPGTPA
jgi:uncharacterized OB-fold protein